MVLFFAWTDMQLINCINTKCHFFQEENADILVYNQGRISEQLLQVIHKKNIFSNVYVAEMEVFFDQIRDCKVFPFTAYIKRNKYFIGRLTEFVGAKKYDVLLAATFWCETLNVYRYLRRINKNVYIQIVEEGMANYDGPTGWVYRTAPASRWKSLARGPICCKSIGVSARKRVQCCYLYQPELSWTHRGEVLKRIPAIRENTNPLVYDILKEWKQQKCELQYMNNQVVYIADAPNHTYDSMEKALDLVKQLPENIRQSVVVKLHPLHTWTNEERMVQNDEGIWIDARRIPIENILLQSDIEDKVLIIDRSSVLLYLKCMLEKEPYFVLLHELPEYKQKKYTTEYQFFIQNLCLMFSSNRKIVIPKSIEEFKKNMDEIWTGGGVK